VRCGLLLPQSHAVAVDRRECPTVEPEYRRIGREPHAPALSPADSGEGVAVVVRALERQWERQVGEALAVEAVDARREFGLVETMSPVALEPEVTRVEHPRMRCVVAAGGARGDRASGVAADADAVVEPDRSARILLDRPHLVVAQAVRDGEALESLAVEPADTLEMAAEPVVPAPVLQDRPHAAVVHPVLPGFIGEGQSLGLRGRRGRAGNRSARASNGRSGTVDCAATTKN